jgi:PAS domain S-box-containing protein/putative nucleotidyltransferase with HDIG domain
MSATENSGVKALLVESDRHGHVTIRDLLARARRTTFYLSWAPDFSEAANLVAATDFDVCLLGDSLGKKADFDRARRSLQSMTGAPMIVISARDGFQPDADAMREEGVADYLDGNQLTSDLLEHAIHYALERKRLEAELDRRSADHEAWRAAIDNLSVGVLITDPRLSDNPVVFVNSAFTAISGFTSEEAVGRNCRFLRHPDSDPATLDAIRDAIKNRVPFNGVLLNRRKDGGLYRNHLVISPVFDKRGTLTAYVGLIEDVTAQFQAQEALRLSEKRFASMVANVPGTIFRMRVSPDSGLEYVYVSERCRDLLGIDADELLSDSATLGRMVHPDDRSSYDSAVAAALAEARPLYWQGRIVRSDATEIVIEMWGNPASLESGEVAWDGLIADVTRRVQSEKNLAQLAAIVEGSNDAIIGKTLDGIVTSWNPAAEAMYGYRADEMIGQSIKRLVPDGRSNDVDTILDRIVRGQRVQNYETVRQTKDGRLIDIALSVSPIKDSAGRICGASTIAQDIRRRREAEEQVDRQLKRIRALRNIDLAITGSLDLRVTLNVVLDQVTSQLQVDAADILLLNPQTHSLEYSVGRGFQTDAVLATSILLGRGHAGRAALERRLIFVPDIPNEEFDTARGAMYAAEGFVSYFAAPLVTKGRVEGVLEVFHRSTMRCGGDWLSFLEALAGQAAIAIENGGLFSELQRSNIELQVAYDSTLEGWSRALDLRDRETEGHSIRVTKATMSVARSMDISANDLVHIRRGALLHDIGKMGIPDAILLKPGALTEEEWVVMKKHPVYAYELLSPIDFLRPALDIPYCHHERWDGGGYPRGLKGEQIPLGVRIFTIMDVWDALSTDRPYRDAWPPDKVRGYIAERSGSQFDPLMVELCLSDGLPT